MGHLCFEELIYRCEKEIAHLKMFRNVLISLLVIIVKNTHTPSIIKKVKRAIFMKEKFI